MARDAYDYSSLILTACRIDKPAEFIQFRPVRALLKAEL